MILPFICFNFDFQASFMYEEIAKAMEEIFVFLTTSVHLFLAFSTLTSSNV